jgi:hypothetical protein
VIYISYGGDIYDPTRLNGSRRQQSRAEDIRRQGAALDHGNEAPRESDMDGPSKKSCPTCSGSVREGGGSRDPKAATDAGERKSKAHRGPPSPSGAGRPRISPGRAVQVLDPTQVSLKKEIYHEAARSRWDLGLYDAGR